MSELRGKQLYAGLNRVLRFMCKICIPGLTQTFVLAKKVCDENQKKERKIENDGRFIQGNQGDKSAIPNEDKRQRFIVGDIDSTLIEGAINVLKFRARGIGMVFRM